MARRFERIKNEDLIVVNDEEVAARTEPFASNEVIVNIDHGEIVFGPGVYEDCEVLVARATAPEVDVDASEVLALETLFISGAGTQVDQRWLRNGLNGLKPKYVAVGGQDTVQWASNKWQISYAEVVKYESTDNVATPDLVTTWTAVNGGIAPLPIVYRVLADTLQQLVEVLGYNTLAKDRQIRLDRPSPIVAGVTQANAVIRIENTQAFSGDATIDFGSYSAVQLICAVAIDNTEVLPGAVTFTNFGVITCSFLGRDGNPPPDETNVRFVAICTP